MGASARPADAGAAERLERYARKREAEAVAAELAGYSTVAEHPDDHVAALHDAWTDRLFDGAFYQSHEPAQPGLPVVNLVFAESREGNTVADDPSQLGGGATDKHLIYEGLSRIDADAVLSGASTARSRTLVLSLWHPRLVALRLARGKPRHPRQVIVTASGELPLEDGLMFQEPSLAACLIAPTAAVPALQARLRDRPWVEVIDAGQPVSLASGLRQLRDRGVRVVSAIGGRRTAQALLDERTIADLYLTTSPISAGEPGTPFYTGPALPLHLVVEKAGRAGEDGVRFRHYRLGRQFLL